jgi:hypothetical protein
MMRLPIPVHELRTPLTSVPKLWFGHALDADSLGSAARNPKRWQATALQSGMYLGCESSGTDGKSDGDQTSRLATGSQVTTGL